MSAAYWLLSDSLAMVGRGVLHSVRSIDAVITAVVLPVVILLLFVYVFGGALDPGGRYVEYVVPGVIVLCAGFGASTTAVGVNADMTTGVIDRFRSLPIAASSVLTGHVVASVLRNLVSTGVVIAIALAIGFTPAAGLLDWLGVLALLIAFMAAISWLATAFGLLARSAEAAGAFSFVVMFLPYLSSAFVPTETMPAALQAIGDHGPITPLVETLRALLTDVPANGHALAATLWCAGLAATGIAASALLFRRR